MEFFTKAQRERLLKNGAASADHVPVVKLFCPWGAATWLITELVPDNNDRLAFGLCDLGVGYPELGYVDLQELRDIKGPMGLKIERDLHFRGKGRPISEFHDDALKHQRIVA